MSRWEDWIWALFKVVAVLWMLGAALVSTLAMVGVVYHFFDPACPTVVCW